MWRFEYPQIWQCVGTIVGVYGIAYILAARDPLGNWPIVPAGLLGKLLGPVGFLLAAMRGQLRWLFGWTVLTNDVIWWIRFCIVPYGSYSDRRSVQILPVSNLGSS